MPHLHLESFQLKPLPLSYDGCTFTRMATNNEAAHECLIQTQVEDSHFFLLYQYHNGRHLLKSDKTSRPAKLHHIKHALMALAEASNLPITQSNIDSISAPAHLHDESALKRMDSFVQPIDKELVIEIGFGSGRHLLAQAKANPTRLHIGLEIYKPSIMQVLKQINLQKLDNIWLLNYDARLFLEFIASNSVRTIFVHFPVPWDKKPHRRVYSEAFIAEAMRTLCPQGTLELRTDSMNYYWYALTLFRQMKTTHLHVQKNFETAIRSKYEERWRKKEKNIFDIIATNDDVSEPLEMPGTLKFPNKPLLPYERLLALRGFKAQLSQMFIHIERLYTFAKEGILLRLSMGDFNRPEHLYVTLDASGVRYFPHAPIPSRANVAMHQQLCEVIYG